MCLLSAIAGLWLVGMDNNIFTQIGLIVLVALACKNAILIVEFAKQRQDAGEDRFTATVSSCKQRLRPILMTSLAFILGVVPLVLSTVFGLLLTPVFYLVIRWFIERREKIEKEKGTRRTQLN